MASTPTAMEDIDHNTALTTRSLVEGKAVAAPGGTSTTPSPTTESPDAVQLTVSKQTETVANSSTGTVISHMPEENPIIAEENLNPSAGERSPIELPLKETPKPKYGATPHAKRGKAISPPKRLNQFATLNSTDEEVESLIFKAQQTWKTVHPCLLGASGRDLEPGGLREKEPEPPPITQ